MSWEIEFNEQNRVIFLIFRSDVSREDVQESNIAFISLMNEKAAKKILTDFTDALSLASTTLDIFSLPEIYKTIGYENPFTEAIVAPKDSKIRKDVEFYETVCVNRGINAKAFEDRGQALEWLLH
jgi:hypothetical protein